MKKRLSILITVFIIVVAILMHNNSLYAANKSLRESIRDEDEVVLYFFGYFSSAPKVSYEQRMIEYGRTSKNWLTGKETSYSVDDLIEEMELPIVKDDDYEINSYNYFKQNIDDVSKLKSKISQLMDDGRFAEEWNSIKDTDEGKLYVGLFNACSAIIQEYNRLDSIYKDVDLESGSTDPDKEPSVFLTVRAWIAEKSGCTTLSLQYEEIAMEDLESTVRNKYKGITADRKEDLLDQAEKNINKIQECKDNGFANFSHNKEVLLAQVEAVRNGIDSLTQSEMSTENGTQAETDEQREREKDSTISGTVVMADNKTEYDEEMGDPINNPEAYKPTGTSEDAKRLQEIGQTIITVLKIVGVAVAVIMLIALGLKYMAGGASEKAEYKKSMIPFLIGAFVLIAGPQLVGIIYDLISKNIQ